MIYIHTQIFYIYTYIYIQNFYGFLSTERTLLHNNAFVARGVQVTPLHYGKHELRLSAIYIITSVGTAIGISFNFTLPFMTSFIS